MRVRIFKAPWLYFLHADTLPREDFSSCIETAINDGYEASYFRLFFDQRHPFLQACCWFTRFDLDLVRFGDPSPWSQKKLLETLLGHLGKTWFPRVATALQDCPRCRWISYGHGSFQRMTFS